MPRNPWLSPRRTKQRVRVSPDGRRLAFTSTRFADTAEIWIAGIDGSNVQQVTHGPGSEQGCATWSPDGRRLAFDSITDDGHTHIWVVDADGGPPHRLTAEAGDQSIPIWSHDGRWIYYSGDEGSGRDVWRVPATGGSPERLIRGAMGHFTAESPDGQTLFFQPKNDEGSPLMAFSLVGGRTRQLLPCVKVSAFAAASQGVYYVPCGPREDSPLHVWDPATGQDHLLGTLDGLLGNPKGITVSLDGRTVLYPRLGRENDFDLMLIENFK